MMPAVSVVIYPLLIHVFVVVVLTILGFYTLLLVVVRLVISAKVLNSYSSVICALMCCVWSCLVLYSISIHMHFNPSYNLINCMTVTLKLFTRNKPSSVVGADACWLLNFTGLEYFSKALELYHNQHKEAQAIQEKRHLGLLLVDKTHLKEKLSSSPVWCLEVSNSPHAHNWQL